MILAGEFDPDPKMRLKPWVINLAGLALLFILLAVAAMFVTGCNATDANSRWLWNTPDEGIIHGHNHSDASYTPGTTSCSGTPMICTTTPGTFIPESWSLDLYADNGSSDHGWTNVSQDAFIKCLDGQRYPDCTQDAT